MDCTEGRQVCSVCRVGDVGSIAEGVVVTGVGNSEEDRGVRREEIFDLCFRAFSCCENRKCEPQKQKREDVLEKHLDMLDHRLKARDGKEIIYL